MTAKDTYFSLSGPRKNTRLRNTFKYRYGLVNASKFHVPSLNQKVKVVSSPHERSWVSLSERNIPGGGALAKRVVAPISWRPLKNILRKLRSKFIFNLYFKFKLTSRASIGRR